MSGALDRLRGATRELHEELEKLPFADALVQGTLPLEGYLGYLKAFAVAHAPLERFLGTTDMPLLQAVWSPARTRMGQLDRDIDDLDGLCRPDSSLLMTALDGLASALRRRTVEEPESLVGYLYVLEGATNGAAVLRPSFAKLVQQHAGGDPRGLAYVSSYGSERETRWAEFGKNLDRALAGREAVTIAAIDAAVELIGHFVGAFRALHPINAGTMRFHAMGLNPEAGNHPVPQVPDDIRIIVDSAVDCWERTPSLHRFGPRGRRFSISDAAYLAFLAEMEQEAAFEQVDWLTSLLTARGVAPVVLIDQLESLHRALAHRNDRYAVLAVLAGRVRDATR